MSRLAIISGSVAFFAPEIGIVPLQRPAADDANAIHAPLLTPPSRPRSGSFEHDPSGEPESMLFRKPLTPRIKPGARFFGIML